MDVADPNVPPDQRHGLFTKILLKGLEGGADVRGRGIIKVTDLADYVRENVAAAAASRRDAQDTRNDRAGSSIFVWRALPATAAPSDKRAGGRRERTRKHHP